MLWRASLTSIVRVAQRHPVLCKNVEKKLASCSATRHYSDKSFKYASVAVDPDINSLVIVQMKNKPVNSLSTDHLTDLYTIFKDLNGDESIKALILTSAYPGIFSAGLDLTSMFNKSKEELFEFWTAFQNMWIELYGSRLITTAVINGHSPAGGCLLAMSCDYRVMAEGKFTIGLNETKLGIVAPFWLKDCMQNLIGFRNTERALMLGSLFSAESAKKMGLIDEVVPMEELMTAAKEEITESLKIPDKARMLTKQMMRKETLTRLTSQQKEDAEFTSNFLSQKHIQKSLEMYLASLAKKK